MIERGHFTIARDLLRRLAEKQPTEPLMSLRGQDLRGASLVAYLDAQPDSRVWISDCPKQRSDGACGCFEEVRRG